MFSQDPLPNDLLHHAPWSETIPTWPINNELLTLIEYCEQKLDGLGYHLKFGIEANLGILSPSEAHKMLTRSRDPSLWWTAPTRNQFLSAAATLMDAPWSPAPLEELYKKCEVLAEGRKQRANISTHPALQNWFENWEKAKTLYQQAIKPWDTPRQTLARKDFMIAALHLLPPALGGLEGLIEQRFESAHYGIGWWDGKDIVECRTLPQRGHESAISNYHHVLWKFKHALEYCGLIPSTSAALAQVHFSLWRNADNSNVFLAEDDQSVALKKTILSCLRDILLLQPLAVGIDSQFVNPGQSIVGSDRTNTLRICENGHWELRIPETYGVTHLARSLAHITQAALIAIQPQRANASTELFNKLNEGLEDIPEACQANTYVDLVDSTIAEGNPIRRIVKMSIVSETPRISCPFESALKSATIDSKGRIQVSEALLTHNIPMMLDKIKHSSAALYSVVQDGEIYDLTSPVAWQALFLELKIKSDSTFDTSTLHPIVAACFAGLRVKEFFTSFGGGELTAPQIISRDFANVRTSLLIANGQFSVHGFEEIGSTLQTIHHFAANARLTCRPENAVGFLAQEYESCTAKLSSNETRTAIDMCSFNIANSAMGWGLEFLNSNQTSLFKSGLQEFQERHVVRTMIMSRNMLHAALPEASRYDAPRSKPFFEGLRLVLADSLDLYSPTRVGRILTARPVYGLDALQIFIRNVCIGNIDPSFKDSTDDFTNSYFHSLGKSAGQRAVRVALAVHDKDNIPQALTRFEQNVTTFYRGHNVISKSGEEPPAFVAETIAAANNGTQEGIEIELHNLRANLAPIYQLREQALQVTAG
jgi:hypothetical protein